MALQGLCELSAHWVCSMEPSPKCSFLRCSWCVHIGVNKRNLLVQWRHKFVCKVTRSTSTTFLLKIEQKDLLDFDTSEPIRSPTVAFLDVWAPQLPSWTIWKRKKGIKVHKDLMSSTYLPLAFLIVLLVKDNAAEAAALEVQEQAPCGWLHIYISIYLYIWSQHSFHHFIHLLFQLLWPPLRAKQDNPKLTTNQTDTKEKRDEPAWTSS